MRILHVVGIMDTGGIETWLMNVYRNIDRSKIQFDFVVHTNKKGYYDEEIKKRGGKIFQVKKFTIFNILIYRKAWEKILKNYEDKIIHCHIRSTSAIILKIAKKYGFNTITHAHNTSNGKSLISYIKNIYQYGIVRYTDIRLACSVNAGNWLFRGNSYKIIRNAIDISLYKYNEEIRRKYRKYYNIDENDIIIGHIGRFAYQKNHDFLIDVFIELKKTNKQIKLVLVGGGEDKIKNRLVKKIKKIGLEKDILFLGVRSDIPQLLQMMDLFVFPSRFEGLGIALIEAQATGLTCFISKEIPEEAIITNLVYRISLNESLSMWANMIIKNMYYKRDDTSKILKDNGFDIQEVAKELENLYFAISMDDTPTG